MKDIIFFKESEFLNKLQIETVNLNELRIVRGSNRKFFEDKKVDIIYDLEENDKRDKFNYKESGLDQVLCDLAKKNRITIGFSFSSVLNLEGERRAILLGRMIQNVRFCRKYKVKMVVGSFAKSEYEIRSNDSLKSFGICLGMHPSEVNFVEDILKEKEEKKKYISKGVKIVE